MQISAGMSDFMALAKSAQLETGIERPTLEIWRNTHTNRYMFFAFRKTRHKKCAWFEVSSRNATAAVET